MFVLFLLHEYNFLSCFHITFNPPVHTLALSASPHYQNLFQETDVSHLHTSINKQWTRYFSGREVTFRPQPVQCLSWQQGLGPLHLQLTLLLPEAHADSLLAVPSPRVLTYTCACVCTRVHACVYTHALSGLRGGIQVTFSQSLPGIPARVMLPGSPPTKEASMC